MKKIILKRTLTYFLLLVALFLSEKAFSQNLDRLYIKLNNGNTVIGKKISEDEQTLVLHSEEMGEFTIQKNSIKTIKPIKASQLKNGKYWFENPNASRYIFAPSGYALGKGEGYYQNFMLAYNSVGYGFTDNLSFGAGIVPITFSGGMIFTLQGKYAFPIVENKLNASAGFLYTNSFGDHLGIGYGVLTYGSKNHNLSLGAGYGWTEEGFTKYPILTISGMTRLGRKFALVTENWLIPIEDFTYDYVEGSGNYTKRSVGVDYELIYSLSVRYMAERVAVDIGIAPQGELLIPVVGITIPFGKQSGR